jgi:hypothetical protein
MSERVKELIYAAAIITAGAAPVVLVALELFR